jgi:hypothetical protein
MPWENRGRLPELVLVVIPGANIDLAVQYAEDAGSRPACAALARAKSLVRQSIRYPAGREPLGINPFVHVTDNRRFLWLDLQLSVFSIPGWNVPVSIWGNRADELLSRLNLVPLGAASAVQN